MRVLIGSDAIPTARLVLRLLWEPRDFWLGVFWNRARTDDGHRYLLVYVCVVPCLPLAFAWRLA